ncbi:hypothetical protein KEM52_006300 [Ascosphaera acerosa]|nr:hypothetical protein KEM52_006300 [Ascosphaera acerosa]
MEQLGGDAAQVRRSTPVAGAEPAKDRRSGGVRSFYSVAKVTKVKTKAITPSVGYEEPTEMITTRSVASGVLAAGKTGLDQTPTNGGLSGTLESTSIHPPRDQEQGYTGPFAMPQRLKIFSQVVVYINGAAASHTSDHRLRHLLVSNGATAGFGAGGGLSQTKIDKEVRHKSAAGVKYVSPDWYVFQALHLFDCTPRSLNRASAT